MSCPHCKHSRSRVVDSRTQPNGTKYRRRKCSKCNWRFSTYEITLDELGRLRSMAGTAEDCARMAGKIRGGGL